MKLYAKAFVELPHGNCTCNIGIMNIPPAMMCQLTDDDAQRILNRMGIELAKKMPQMIRILALEYISEQEARDILSSQRNYRDFDDYDENEE